MSLMVDYPKREKFFSHKFVRILQKSCATMDIGRDAALLLCFIAHTEDAAKYSGPVRFWNEQLMTTMDFKSPKQLQDARSKAIEFGWLYYERSGNRQVGRYFVCIPADAEGLDDSIIEPNHSANHSRTHSANGTNSGGIAERIGDGLRNEKVTNSGKPSIPIPEPIPVPSPNTLPETSADASVSVKPEATAIDPELLGWLEWWNILHNQKLVPSAVNETKPSQGVLAGWRRVQKSAALKDVLLDRVSIELEIRASEYIQKEPWFRLEKLLGGKNPDGEYIATKLISGGFRPNRRVARDKTDPRGTLSALDAFKTMIGAQDDSETE